MIDQIYVTILAAFPALTAILGVIAAVIKIIGTNKTTFTAILENFNEFKEKMIAEKESETKEIENLKSQIRLLLEDNHKLQKRYDELLTELTKINHNSEV